MKYLALSVVCISGLLFLSCEGCVKSVTKKATSVSMSAIEGVSEAVNEKGDVLAEKTTDAIGSVAKGMGTSLERQLNEHAEHVASVTGRTLVQTVEGLDKGVTREYYDEIPFTANFANSVSLDFFGKIKSKAVIDAYFIILEKGTYNCTFEFLSENNTLLMKKESTIEKINETKRYSVVSFALNTDEEQALKDSKNTKIIVTKK